MKILNNRWSIVLLSFFAIAMIVRSLMPYFSASQTLTEEIDEYDWFGDSEIQQESVVSVSRLESVVTEALFWNTEPKRDPFGDKTLFSSGDARLIQGQANAKTGDISKAELELSALVSGEISKIAVINGEIVREGDWIQLQRVNRIDKDSVLMSDGKRSYTLHLVK